MELICESSDLQDYLVETEEVNFSDPIIKEKANKLFHSSQSDKKSKIRGTFKVPESHLQLLML